MSDQIKQISARIKDLREIAGLSEETLSKELGVTTELYKQYERRGVINKPRGQ